MHFLRKRTLVLLLVCSLFFSLFAAAPEARAVDAVITKVLTTISATPVALMDPSLISAATSTPGCYIASAGWFDVNGNLATGAFNAETYRLEIRIAASEGYLIDPAAACYLNNSAVTAIPDGTGKSITLVREYTAAIWAPTIYKNPGAETVDEGGFASFVVSGTYIRDYQWALVSPNENESVLISNLKSRFPQMESTGNGSTKLMLYNVPYELNGWKVVCNFVGAGNNNIVTSQPAMLTVIPDPSRATPTPAPTPVSAASPSPAADAVQQGTETAAPEVQDAEASPAPEATPAVEEPPVHVHSFSEAWSYDASTHWHECPEDGARADEGSHELTWTVENEPTLQDEGKETAVCSVCGVTLQRTTPKLERPALEMPGIRLLLLLLLFPVDLLLLIFRPFAAKKGRRNS